MARALHTESVGDLHRSPPRLARALNRLSAPRTGPAPLLRAHRWVYDHSDGRIGHGMIGAPTLLLRTTGRHSGLRRTTALCYTVDAGRVVLAASNNGSEASPAWYHNLVSNPSVEVQVARRRLAGNAVVLDPSHPDYRRLWERMNATINDRLGSYQAKTRRPIPLVAVTLDLAASPAEQTANTAQESFAELQRALLDHYGVTAASRFVEIASPSLRVHLLEAGHGDPIVVLHGGDGEAVDWAPLMAEMQDSSHLFALDRPGFGLTDPFDYHSVDLRRHAGNFVVSAMDALDLESAHVMGGSMGGFFALAAALDHPDRVRSVILVGYPLGLTRSAPVGLRIIALIPALARRFMKSAGAEVDSQKKQYRRMFHIDPDTVPELYFQTRLAGVRLPGVQDTWATLLHRLAALRGLRAEVYLGDEVSRLSQPTLIIWGEHDMAPASKGHEIANRIPNATFVCLEGIGHFPFLEVPAKTADLIADFLRPPT